MWFVNRKTTHKLPIIITENGVSDDTDYLRPPYLVEHLVAMRQAMNEGVDVRGYVFWTISDNWEWKDGYCPKFGLFSVNRPDNLRREPREYSVRLFSDIVKTGAVTQQQRDAAWNRYAAVQGGAGGVMRSMCRAEDGQSAVDVAVKKPFGKSEWRFDLNRPSRRLDVIDSIGFQDKAAIVGLLGEKIPFWLRSDTERRKVIGSLLSVFSGFEGSKFSASTTKSGNIRLGIHNEPGTRIACEVTGQLAPTTFVFEDSVYLSLPKDFQSDTTAVNVEGMRLFLGPKFSSNFNFRAPIEKVTLKNGVLTFHSSSAPLLYKVASTDLLAPPPPPQAKCQKVSLKEFGDGLSGH